MEMKKRAKKDLLMKLKSAMKEDDNEEMEGKLAPKLQGKMKATVIANDKEGLEKGLSMAQKIMAKRNSMMGEDEESEETPMSIKKDLKDDKKDIKEDKKELFDKLRAKRKMMMKS